MTCIEERRSVRRFTDEPIARTCLEELVTAATLAPSPKNRQPWSFVIVDDADAISALAGQMRAEVDELFRRKGRADIAAAFETIEVMEQSAAIVFVLRDTEIVAHDDGVAWDMAASDVEVVELMSIGAAIENMLLRTTELGLGAVWCADHLYAYRTVEAFLGVKKPVLAMVCLGHPADAPCSRPPRKPLEDVAIWFDESK